MLSPAFDPTTTAYVASVPAVASSVQITATTTDPTATIQVNGTTVASGVVSAVPLSAGVNTIPVVVTAQDGVTARTTTVIIDNSAFGVWKSGKFTGAGELANAAVSGDTATPAHDGITNLMKYAMALEPKADGSGSMPVTGTNFGYMTFTYRKNKTAADVTYTVQSSALITGIWTPATTVTSQSDQGTYTLVTVRDTVPLAGHPHRFMRLQVSR